MPTLTIGTLPPRDDGDLTPEIDAAMTVMIADVATVNPEVGAWLTSAYARDPNRYALDVQQTYDYLFLFED